MSKLILMLTILMSSIDAVASENSSPILKYSDPFPRIDTSFQLISSYDRESEVVFVQFNLREESIVALELYDTQNKLVKVWHPEIAQTGGYRSELLMKDVPKGKYRMLVLINDETYQQAIFKL